MRQRLKGSYILLVVTSVGMGAKWMTEWNLTLEPTPPAQDSVWRQLWLHGGRPVHFPLVGTMSYLGGGYLNADRKLAPPRPTWVPRGDSVRVRYEPETAVLRLDGAPFDALDAGTFYWVYAVDVRGGFSGRWLGGGLAMAIIETPFGTLGEQDEGYFCARRISPS